MSQLKNDWMHLPVNNPWEPASSESSWRTDWTKLQPLERVLIRLVLLGYLTLIILGLCGVFASK